MANHLIIADPMRARMTEFAAQRDAELQAADTDLHPLVVDALDRLYAGDEDWYLDLVEGAETLWLETYGQVAGAGDPSASDMNTFGSELGAQLMDTSTRYGTTTEAQADTVTRWVSTYTVNNATSTAASSAGGDVAWVTMHDDDVRASHAALDGTIRPVGGTFDVDGVSLHYPGEPVGPPDAWINCRCVLLPLEAQMTAAAVTVSAPPTITFNGDPTTTTSTTTSSTYADTTGTATPAEPAETAETAEPTEGYDALDHTVTWHGVIAPVGVLSGDRREFAPGALTFRDLPLPLRWQKIDAPGHDGSVVVGNITKTWEDDGLIKAEGTFASNAEAAEVIELIAEGMLRGVSVDLDGDTTFDLVTEGGEPFDLDSYSPGDPAPIARAVDARVTSAAIVPIPAFQEAYVRLGAWGDEAAAEPVLTAAGGCIPCAAAEMDGYYDALQSYAISETEWDGAASRFDDDQWKTSTIVDRGESYATPKERYAVPIKEPNGDLSRAGVHAAASRIDQVDAPAAALAAGKRKLVAAYRQLDEDPPEGLQASALAWLGEFATAPPFPPQDDAGDGEDAPADAPAVGDTVTWTATDADGETEEHTGTVDAVDGDMATVSEGDDTFEVAVSELTVVDEPSGDAPVDEGRPFAVTSNPGTHDGPGWITNPDDTQRLRTYWTKGEGAAKIRWGQPGDFNRCRTQLAKYITNPRYLAGTCSNLHKVALGVWPGQEAAAEVLTAAAAPAFTIVAAATADPVSADWFADPQLTELTPLTVDGRRVYGHLAGWGTCHIGLGLSVGDGEECITPPESPSNYAYFRTDAVRTVEGDLVPVGHITLGTGHAPASMANRPAAAHYDNTGSVVADIAVGEDEHGIWFAGALRDGADPDVLQAAALSGDWRTIGGHYELVAALGVNVQGFPIPRLTIGASAAGTTSLVAAGVVLPRERFQFDATTMAKDVYNETMAIGRRADRRRQLTAKMRSARRAELTARLMVGP